MSWLSDSREAARDVDDTQACAGSGPARWVGGGRRGVFGDPHEAQPFVLGRGGLSVVVPAKNEAAGLPRPGGRDRGGSATVDGRAEGRIGAKASRL